MNWQRATIIGALASAVAGCRGGGASLADEAGGANPFGPVDNGALQQVRFDSELATVQPAQFEAESEETPQPVTPASETLPAPDEPVAAAASPDDAPSLQRVAQSVREHFPLIQQAIAGRTVASGQVLEAWGAFDHKFDLFGQAQPLDFYENYQGKLGVKRETYWGGSTFAGYKIGRGTFEPWFGERNTNDGGEFGVGFTAPIVGDRVIDERRSALWQAQVERTRVDAVVRSQVIFAVRDGVVAYWEWVAAGANLKIAEDILQLGLDRIDFLEKEARAEQKAPIDITDNQRIIVSRRAKAIDARRKVEQSAAKLALFLRTPDGRPAPPSVDPTRLSFPDISPIDPAFTEGDVALALASRPELAELSAVQRQLNIALNEARNNYLPDMDAGLWVAQDVGMPTSSKRDKSELELEATLTMSVPLERRKALGKLRQVRGKLAQVNAKTQFAQDKIAAEVSVARAALVAASQRVEQTTRGLSLAEQMLAAERRFYELEQVTLFELNIREQQLAEAAGERVAAQLDYEVALADYAVALGLDAGRLAELDGGPLTSLQPPPPEAG